MRRRLTALLVALAVGSPGPAWAIDEFSFEGSGWGHGVGMPQYGARALADVEGYSANQILSYYYTGVSVDDYSLGYALWVGLSQNNTKARFEAIGGDLELCHQGGGPCLTAEVGEQWDFRAVAGGCRFFEDDAARGQVGDCHADVSWSPQPDVRVVLTDLARTYGRGILHFRPDSLDGFHVSMEIGLERYLYGLGEMPSSWAAAALKAQAIAGRTYAVRRALFYGDEPDFSPDRRKDCWCTLYASVLDQAYVGYSKESEATYGVRWVEAVDDTEGQVMTHPDETAADDVILANYHSSSGGKTENNTDGFGSSVQLPYLVSVDDPWSLHPAAGNPNAHWTQGVAESVIADALGLADVLSIEVTARNESGSAATMAFTGKRGGSTVTESRSGLWARSTFGLKSTYLSEIFFPPFVDDDGNTHEADIALIAAEGITRGCNPPANDRFCPDDQVTREQMAAFLRRMLDLPEGPDAFTDDGGSIFEEDINAIAAEGITRGCNPPANDRFCPDDQVTREQMAAFLVRALDLPPGPDAFTDDQGSTFEEDINALAAADITRGCNPPENDHFCPTDEVTRAQMASFLARSLPLID